MMKDYFKKIGNTDLSFGMLYWTLFFGGLPFILVAALLASFGLKPMQVNNVYYDGIIGFIIPLISLPVVVFISTVFIWFFLFVGKTLIRIIF
ncbi:MULTISPECIES: hypothetical protein [unclassified Sphingobacterium]|uniref:hypothetical protein n=1 Tax=unclassified Sphingobacterium TaxID=2609468 RepID=UPI0025DD7340|nr:MULTISPECIES: hypothetical protein [unclassified Sphingobacterium]